MVPLGMVIVSSLSLNLLRGRIRRCRWSCTSCLSYSGGPWAGSSPCPPRCCPPPSPQSPPASGGGQSSSSHAQLHRGCRGSRFSPAPCPPARGGCCPHAQEVQGCAQGWCSMEQALQTPLPTSALLWCYH